MMQPRDQHDLVADADDDADGLEDVVETGTISANRITTTPR